MTKVKIPPVITFNRTEEDRNHRDNFAYVSRVLFQSSASGGKTIDSFLKEVCRWAMKSWALEFVLFVCF